MDKLSVQQKSPKHGGQDKAAKSKKKKGSWRSPIKVVYISNPMMVTTTASEFKDRVQELTGRYSNVFDALAPDQREEAPPAAAAAVRSATKPGDQAPAASASSPAAAVENSSTSTGSSSAVSDPSGHFLDQLAAGGGAAVEPCTPLDSNFDDFSSSSSYPYMGYDCFADLCYQTPADELNYDRSVFW